MPLNFELRWPDETTPTASFTTDEGPTERAETPIRGVAEQPGGNPLRMYTYTMSKRGRVWEFGMAIPSAKDDELAAFEESVKGLTFRLWDNYKAAWRWVKFRGIVSRRHHERAPGYVRVAMTLVEQQAP